MKPGLTALCALLLAAFCSEVLSAPAGADIPTSCCFSYTARKIPRSHVQDYFITSSMCPQPAIIFITRKGREVCANPEEEWVDNYVTDLELH
ncbi:C-C motif chemokine 4-like [Rhinatrema bivittatum]|uniref:C-C motif chemokine 4-like n=1 Tax=Rhinatrema bivittatum TaxID=194408 RepID=UPI00112AD433|nr:C-C motif chemokine 4-like [Rhinatrema bivittatum]